LAQFLPDKEIVDLIKEDYKWADDLRKRHIEDWRRIYRLYKAYNDPAMFPFDANLSVPIAFWVIETQIPYIMEMIFANGEFVEVAGKTVKGQITASAVKAVLEYHFTNSFDIHNDMYEFIKQLLMYGTSIYKTYWDYRTEKRTYPVPIYIDDQLAKWSDEEREVEIANNPTGYVPDLWNFGVDPNAPTIKKARFAFEDMWLDPVFIIDMARKGLFKRQNLKEALGQDLQAEVNEGLQDREDVLNIESYQKSPYIQRGKIHCVDYWGYLPKGFDWEVGAWKTSASERLCHCIIAFQGGSVSLGDGVVLLAEETPFHHNRLPYADARIHHNKGEFYGSGDLEFIESLCLELTDMRNIRLDNLNKTTNKMFSVNENADLDEDELIWRPGGVIHRRNVDDVTVLETGGIDPASFRETEDVRRDIEQITGVNDFSSGMFRSSTGFNDTATGISLIQQASLKKVGLKGNVVQRAIRDIAFLTFNLVAQYEPYGTQVRKMMPDDALKFRFLDVSPEALSNMYDFNIPNSSAAGNKQFRVQQMIQLLQYMVPIAQQTNMQIDYRAFLNRLLQEMDFVNPSELLGYPEFNMEIPPEMDEEAQYMMYDPAAENHMMIEQHKEIMPRSREDHPTHLMTHLDAYQNVRDIIAKRILQKHINETRRLMNEERELLSQSLANQSMAGSMANQLSEGANSPQGAGGTNGMESMISLLGQRSAGHG
jgi:hypothetical protein